MKFMKFDKLKAKNQTEEGWPTFSAVLADIPDFLNFSEVFGGSLVFGEFSINCEHFVNFVCFLDLLSDSCQFVPFPSNFWIV